MVGASKTAADAHSAILRPVEHTIIHLLARSEGVLNAVGATTVQFENAARTQHHNQYRNHPDVRPVELRF